MEQHGGQAGIGAGGQHWRRLVIELMAGIVLSVILAVMVGLAGSAMTVPPDAPAVRSIVPIIDEAPPQDFDPRDPLVRCTVLETHTHCIREAS